MAQWDAELYLRFASERTQPSIDLIERINLQAPRRVIDLGSGPGNSTEPLRRRWPDATIIGLDSSSKMIAAAKQAYPDGIWELGDAASWKAREPFDLVFSNAMLQVASRSRDVMPPSFRSGRARGSAGGSNAGAS